MYEQGSSTYLDIIKVGFNHKINEEHMDDIAEFLEHVLETLDILNEV